MEKKEDSYIDVYNHVNYFLCSQFLSILQFKLGLIDNYKTLTFPYFLSPKYLYDLCLFDYPNIDKEKYHLGGCKPHIQYFKYLVDDTKDVTNHVNIYFEENKCVDDNYKIFYRPDELNYHVNKYLKDASVNLTSFYRGYSDNSNLCNLLGNMNILRDIKLIDKTTMMKLKNIGVSYSDLKQDIFQININSQIFARNIEQTKPLTIKEYTRLYGYATSSNYYKKIHPYWDNNLDAIYLCEETINNVANNITSHEDTLSINKKLFKANIQKKRTIDGNFDKNIHRNISKNTPIPTLEYISNNWFKLVLYHELGHILLGDHNNTERNAQTLASIFARNVLDSLCIEYISYFQDEEYQNAPLWGLDFND